MDLSAIEERLRAIRRRIRRVQFWRGLSAVGVALFGGLLFLMTLAYLLGPMSVTWRWSMLVPWLAGVLAIGWRLWLQPLRTPLPLLRVARWLELRHPEVEERVSTALQLARGDSDLSSVLLGDVCQQAEKDVRDFQPAQEVSERLVRRAWLPALGLVLLLGVILGIWPDRVGRLLAQTLIPSSTLGNAGALEFVITPGDLEVLEGEEVVISITYEGKSKEPLLFVRESADGRVTAEPLSPVTRADEQAAYRYHLTRATQNFRYRVRAGDDESDQFAVTVRALPRVERARVQLEYPAYTALPMLDADLGAGFSALPGTHATVTVALNQPFPSAQFRHGAKQQTLAAKKGGAGFEWSWTVLSDSAERGTLEVGEAGEVLSFETEVEEDEVPVIQVLAPRERDLRMRSTDQIIFVYEVVERFDLTAASVEIESGEDVRFHLKDEVPVRQLGRDATRWQGEAMVYLGSLLDRLQGARNFRIRLAVCDNRPPELSGPGVGYSEWFAITLDEKAPSLVQQELRRAQKQTDRRLGEAQQQLRKARAKMDALRPQVGQQELSQRARQQLAEARDELTAAQKTLKELQEMMATTVQAHRRDKVAAAAAKAEESRRALASAPLQDTADSRRSDLEAASRSADEAEKMLQRLRDDVNADRRKVEQLARLEELARDQQRLARQAEATPEKDWRKNQVHLSKKLRNMARQSPFAEAALAEQAADRLAVLSQRGIALAEDQNQLRELTRKPDPDALRDLLQREQKRLTDEVAAQLAKARRDSAPQADALAGAEAELRQFIEDFQPERAEKAAQALADAQADPQAQARQEAISQALASLNNDPTSALQALQKMSATRARDFSREVDNAGQAIEHSGAMRDAERTARAAAREAEQVTPRHREAADKLRRTGGLLNAAASEARARAAQLATRRADESNLSLPPRPMAQAFDSGNRASGSSQPGERQQLAQAAAQSLSEAAREARSALAEGRQAHRPSSVFAQSSKAEKGKPQPENQGEAASGIQEEQPDPGVPPTLSRLGISASDWERLRGQMESGLSGSARERIPDDYRDLVKRYYRELEARSK